MKRITKNIQQHEFSNHLDHFIQVIEHSIETKSSKIRNVTPTLQSQSVADMNLLKRIRYSAKAMQEWVNKADGNNWRLHKEDLINKYQNMNRDSLIV